MYIYENGFAFCHIVKCGGTSVRDSIPCEPLKEFDGIQHKHRQLRLIRNEIGCDRFDNLTIYVNIRNPFDRIKSAYYYRNPGNKVPCFYDWFWGRFLEYERGNNDNPQHCFFMIDGKVPNNVNIVKLEEADEQWPVIINKWFGVNRPLKRSNVTVRSNKQPAEFDECMRSIVMDREHWVLNNYYKEI